MGIIHKLSLKLILLQVLFLYFFSQAAERFGYILNSDVYECIYQSVIKPDSKWDCMDKYPDYSMGYLMVYPIYSMLCGLIVGLIIVGILNWRKKKHYLNTILVCVIYITLHLSRFFSFSRDLDVFLNSFGNIFSDKFWAINLITVHIYLLCAVVLIWLSVKNSSSKKSS